MAQLSRYVAKLGTVLFCDFPGAADRYCWQSTVFSEFVILFKHLLLSWNLAHVSCNVDDDLCG